MLKQVILSDDAYLARLEGGEAVVPTPTARMVQERRYLRRDEEGALCETPDGLYDRVARHLAGAEPAELRHRARAVFAGICGPHGQRPTSPNATIVGLESFQTDFRSTIARQPRSEKSVKREWCLSYKLDGGVPTQGH